MKIKEGGVMDIQEIQEKFEDLLLANPDFDESLLEKDEEGCYSDSDIQHMYSMFEAGTEVGEQWKAAKAQAVPDNSLSRLKNTITAHYDRLNDVMHQEGYSDKIFGQLMALEFVEEVIDEMIEAQEPAND